MFQFSGFPSIHYGFMHGSQVLHLRGFPIRKSADRSLFAAPRSLSQLVTSFFGSWCQGIHLMLFLAWTSSFFKFSKNCWISLLILRFFCLSLANNWLGLYLLSLKRPFLLFSPCLTICSFCYPINGKTLFLMYEFLHTTDSLKSFSIICSFLYFLLFGFQWTFCLSTMFHHAGGLKWTRTTDLALIRRAL